MRLSAVSLSVPLTPVTTPTTEEAGVAATRMQAATRGRLARTHIERQQQTNKRAQASKVEHDLILKRGDSSLGRLTNVDSMRAAIKKASGDGSFVIDPRSSEWTHWWDLVVVILLVVVLFLTPYEVAFLEPGLVEPMAVALFVVNRLFDLVFFLDMAINFNRGFQLGAKQGHRWVKDLPSIRKNYIKGWFTVDLLSIMPWWIPPLITQGEGDTDLMRAVRAVRLLRLLKLSRVLRLSSVIKRYEMRMDVTYATISLYKLFFFIVAWAHGQACVWGIIVTFEPPATEDRTTWQDVLAEGNGLASRNDLEPGAKYLAALYWSIQTLTSIGYGAMLPPDNNPFEHFVCSLLMFVSSIFWIYLTGQVCSIASTMESDVKGFHATLDQLNHFMRTRELDAEMRVRLRSYFHYSRNVRQVRTDAQLLERMSPLLRGTVALEANRKWLDRVWYFSMETLPKGDWKLRTEHEAFISQLAMRLQPFAFVREEKVPIGALHILQKGLVMRGFVFLSPGRVWGYDMLMQDKHHHLVNRTPAIALTYIEVIALARDDLMESAEGFPSAERRIRAARARMLMAKLLSKHVQRVQNSSFSQKTLLDVLNLEDSPVAKQRPRRGSREWAEKKTKNDLNEAVQAAVSSALKESKTLVPKASQHNELSEGTLQALSARIAESESRQLAAIASLRSELAAALGSQQASQ